MGVLIETEEEGEEEEEIVDESEMTAEMGFYRGRFSTFPPFTRGPRPGLDVAMWLLKLSLSHSVDRDQVSPSPRRTLVLPLELPTSSSYIGVSYLTGKSDSRALSPPGPFLYRERYMAFSTRQPSRRCITRYHLAQIAS